MKSFIFTLNTVVTGGGGEKCQTHSISRRTWVATALLKRSRHQPTWSKDPTVTVSQS